MRNDIDINKTVVFNKFPFDKQDFLNILFVTLILHETDLYGYSIYKCLYKEEILMKIEVFIF